MLALLLRKSHFRECEARLCILKAETWLQHSKNWKYCPDERLLEEKHLEKLTDKT